MTDWDDDQPLPFVGFNEDGPKLRDHRDLRMWNLSMSLTQSIYETTRTFPADERFGLTAQMRRAAVSIPANIAEGFGRETTGAYIQFVRISQGSAKELETLIDIAKRVGFLNEDRAAGLAATVTEVSKMTRALIRALERKV
jgi:four helix bundle protein